MLLKTPYDAPVAKAYDLKKIHSEVAEAVSLGEYASAAKLQECINIYGRPNPAWPLQLSDDTVALVRNKNYKTNPNPIPLPFKLRTAAGKELYAIDVRRFTEEMTHPSLFGRMYITEEPMVFADIISWMRCWDAREYGDIRRLHDYVTGSFAIWVCTVVSNITGINGGVDLDIIRFLACYWFQSQFSETAYEMDDQERARMRKIICNALMRPDAVVEYQTKEFPYIGSLEDFIEAVKKYLPNNRRVHLLSRALYYQQCSQQWYGQNTSLMCSVALEYPPFFVSMMYHAIANNAASGSTFTRCMTTLRDTQKRADFLATYRRVINVWKQP